MAVIACYYFLSPHLQKQSFLPHNYNIVLAFSNTTTSGKVQDLNTSHISSHFFNLPIFFKFSLVLKALLSIAICLQQYFLKIFIKKG